MACTPDSRFLERIGPTGYHTNIYIDDNLLVERITGESRLYRAISKVEPAQVGDLAAYLCRVRREPTKILVVSAEENLDRLSAELKKDFSDRLHITKSKPYFLEFMHPEATKARALQAVADYYGIAREKIIAVGDSYNDLEMVDYAGLGVVVANAREEVKLKADYVTSANTEGGVARVISKFIFNGED
ncbi:MAG: HAD-IIB family hydrolase [Bacillota bacterium]